MTSLADNLRIGGEFELDSESFGLSGNQAAPTMPSAFSCWTDTGRSALLIAACDILQRGGKPVVWLPAFCCHSVTQSFQQAGFTALYYSAAELHGEDSTPPTPRRDETILFVHYFGHLNQLRLAQVCAWQQAGVHIIEDAAQAGLTQEVGKGGHYVFTSLRKFLPQPDGAFLGSRHALNFPLADPDETFVSAKVVAKLMRGAHAVPQAFLSILEQAEAHLDHSAIVPRRASWLGRYLMSRTDLAAVASRRRLNCQLLYDAVCTDLRSNLTPLTRRAAEGEVPLGLPVRVSGGRRDELRRFLAEHSVFCPIHWRLPHVPQSIAMAADHRLASDTVTFPIDQRMDDRHIRRLIALLRQFFADEI